MTEHSPDDDRKMMMESEPKPDWHKIKRKFAAPLLPIWGPDHDLSICALIAANFMIHDKNIAIIILMVLTHYAAPLNYGSLPLSLWTIYFKVLFH